MKTQEKNAASSSILEDELTKLMARIDALKDEIAKKEQRRSELKTRILEIYKQPLSGSDVVEFVGEVIDFRANAYAERLKGFDVVQQLRLNAPRHGMHGGLELTLEDVETTLGREVHLDKKSFSGAPIHGGPWNLEVVPQHGDFMHWQFFFFGDLMKEKLRSVFEACGYAAKEGQGGTLTEKRAEIAALLSEIKAVSDDIEKSTREIEKLSSPLKIVGGKL